MGRNRTQRSHGPWRRSRTERAATLVEYAMIVAVFVIPVGLSLSYLNNGTKAKMGRVADGVAHSPTTMPADGGGGAGGGGGASTTTTESTTTTSTTSTTTTSTTTTTTTTTTTAPPPPTKGSNNGATSSVAKNGKNNWDATATTKVTSADGKAVKGATVTFEICERKGNKGAWECSTFDDTTDASGNASATDSGIGNTYTSMQARVKSITLDGYVFAVDGSWDSSNSPSCTKKC